MEAPATQTASKAQAFVKYVIGRAEGDTGFGAALRRADNPATEYQSWEHLSAWCDLEKSWERIPFCTVGAAAARAKPSSDGTVRIGRAIGLCYTEGGVDGSQSDAAKAKLRRLIACEDREEACRVLRPMLRLIASRGIGVSYGALLDDLCSYSEWTRQRWAMDFYRKGIADAGVDL